MAIPHAEHGKVVDLNTIQHTVTSSLIKHQDFEVIRLVVEPDREIPPHRVDGPITVQCLEGTCEFHVDGDARPMVPGSWIYLEGNTMHSVTALQSSVLLVTILFKKD